MCLARRNLNPKARRFIAIGNLCLFTSITLGLFDKDIRPEHVMIYHFTRGALLGLAICFLYATARLSRCGPQNQG
jgi:hypothetical protein